MAREAVALEVLACGLMLTDTPFSDFQDDTIADLCPHLLLGLDSYRNAIGTPEVRGKQASLRRIERDRLVSYTDFRSIQWPEPWVRSDDDSASGETRRIWNGVASLFGSLFSLAVECQRQCGTHTITWHFKCVRTRKGSQHEDAHSFLLFGTISAMSATVAGGVKVEWHFNKSILGDIFAESLCVCMRTWSAVKTLPNAPKSLRRIQTATKQVVQTLNCQHCVPDVVAACCYHFNSKRCYNALLSPASAIAPTTGIMAAIHDREATLAANAQVQKSQIGGNHGGIHFLGDGLVAKVIQKPQLLRSELRWYRSLTSTPLSRYTAHFFGCHPLGQSSPSPIDSLDKTTGKASKGGIMFLEDVTELPIAGHLSVMDIKLGTRT